MSLVRSQAQELYSIRDRADSLTNLSLLEKAISTPLGSGFSPLSISPLLLATATPITWHHFVIKCFAGFFCAPGSGVPEFMQHDTDTLNIGVDPGKSGAIAFIPSRGEPWVIKNTSTDRDLSDAVEDAMREYTGQVFASIEHVHSSPQMGVKSAFTFGMSYGKLLMLLACHKVPYEPVTPRIWQGKMQCLTGGDKNVSKAKAQALFPDIKITHAIADALLIAEYGRRLKSA